MTPNPGAPVRPRDSQRAAARDQHLGDGVQIDDALGAHGGVALGEQFTAFITSDELAQTTTRGGGEHADLVFVEASDCGAQVLLARLRVPCPQGEPRVENGRVSGSHRQGDAGAPLSRVAGR